MDNYIHTKPLDIIAHPCPNINGGLNSLWQCMVGWLHPTESNECKYLFMSENQLNNVSLGSPWTPIDANSLKSPGEDNWPKLQIPKCTCSILHNATFRTEMFTLLFWLEQYGIWNICILWFVKLFNYSNMSQQYILRNKMQRRVSLAELVHRMIPA